MSQKFNITVDRIRGILDMTLTGFWCHEDTVRFTAAVHAALDRLKGRSVAHVTLIDVQSMPIQSQDVLEACHPLRYTEPQPRRMAIVVGDGLARMQMRRVAGDALQVFYDRRSAETWLLEPIASLSSRPPETQGSPAQAL